jgi:hypothetical protein
MKEHLNDTYYVALTVTVVLLVNLVAFVLCMETSELNIHFLLHSIIYFLIQIMCLYIPLNVMKRIRLGY